MHGRRLFAVARHCHALREVAGGGGRQWLGDPMEVTLLEMTRSVPGDDHLRVDEIAFEVILAAVIIYTPLGNQIFGTAPLAAGAWLFMLPLAASMLAAEELRQWLLGWRQAKRG